MRIRSFLDEARRSGLLLDVELLLAEVLDQTREWVFSHPEFELNAPQVKQMETHLHQLNGGFPVAYLIHRKPFWNLDFYVDQRVLIPRPETEHLVDAVLRVCDLIEGVPRILDVGTGCGAIALALQSELKDAFVMGVDISPGAIEVSRLNANRLELSQVVFKVSDLICDIDFSALAFDVVVTNLPYIGTERFHFVEKGVKAHEPHVALFGGADGLDLYRRLFDQLNQQTHLPRFILGEFGSLQRASLEEVFSEFFPDAEIEFGTDLAGLDRFFTVDLKGKHA